MPEARVSPAPGVTHVLEAAVVLTTDLGHHTAVLVIHTGGVGRHVPRPRPPTGPDGHVTLAADNTQLDQQDQSHGGN